MERWLNGRAGGRIDGQVHLGCRMDGQVVEWSDIWSNGQTGGQTDGHMVEWTVR